MKIPSPDQAELNRSESGQAAVLVAILFFFAFLALASLAIDGAITYLGRRDLQNVADAAALSACTDLANSGTADSARTAATGTIAANLGSSVIFTPNIGTGTGLLQGIEISQPEVRVALRRPVPTVLTQFLGRSQSIIDAKAHCNALAGGGPLPIAVQRYSGEDKGTMVDYLANKAASTLTCKKGKCTPAVPYPDDTVLITVPGRYGLFQVPVPCETSGPRACASGINYAASDGALNDPQTGIEVSLVGQHSTTNNGSSYFNGIPMLDIRNVGGNPVEYYNGVDGQANSNKSVTQGWILQRGYPGPFPQVGSEVAAISGVSNPDGAQAVQHANYNVGDIVAVIVYDGNVWTTPDYAITLTPSAANPNGITTNYPASAANPVSYTMSIVAANSGGVHWITPLNFNLQFSFSNAATLPAGTHVVINGTDIAATNLNYQLLNVTEAAGWTGSVQIYSESAGPAITQTQRFLSGLNLIATSSSGAVHGASSNYGFGAITLPDYTLHTSAGSLVVQEGASLAGITVLDFGADSLTQDCTVAGTVNVLLNGTPQPWASFFSSSPTINFGIYRNQDTLNTFGLTALDPVLQTGNYELEFAAPASACGPAHTVTIPIKIIPPQSKTTNNYIIVQGYALFRVSKTDANDVWGYAISPLYTDYASLPSGLRPRLVPWN